MSELIEKHEQLLDKISDLKAKGEDKAEYKVVKEMLIKWSDKIDVYNRKLKEIREVVNEQ